MTTAILEGVFQAYFEVVPYGFFLGIFGLLLMFNLVFLFVDRWNIL